MEIYLMTLTEINYAVIHGYSRETTYWSRWFVYNNGTVKKQSDIQNTEGYTESTEGKGYGTNNAKQEDKSKAEAEAKAAEEKRAQEEAAAKTQADLDAVNAELEARKQANNKLNKTFMVINILLNIRLIIL